MSQVVIHIIPGKEYHLEGDHSALQPLLDRLNLSPSLPASPSSTPSLQDVLYKHLPKSEPEWLLVYAHFLSKPQFTRTDLISSYKATQRYTYNISKNLSHNLAFCVKHTWFTALDANTFQLHPTGSRHLEEILARS